MTFILFIYFMINKIIHNNIMIVENNNLFYKVIDFFHYILT